MHTRGALAPETADDARDRYDRLGRVAQVVVREIAKAMGFDREEYDRRVTPDVIEQARNALFASLLEVTVGTREEFDAWAEGYDGEIVEVGSENVDRVVWHAPAFAGTAVAASFQDAEDAAVGTLRRQAFGRIYRDLV